MPLPSTYDVFCNPANLHQRTVQELQEQMNVNLSDGEDSWFDGSPCQDDLPQDEDALMGDPDEYSEEEEEDPSEL